jgi:aminodeoxyfutalosine deaminase
VGDPIVIAADAVIALDAALPKVLSNAGVVVAGERIAGVGELADLRRQFGILTVQRERGVLLPGLVNAHTHLELSDRSAEELRAGSFPEWVANLMAGRPPTEQLEGASREAVRKGVAESLRAGVTTIGDISRQAAATRGELATLGGPAGGGVPRVVSFGEVLGLGKLRARAEGLIAAAAAGTDQMTAGGLPLLRRGISPHAPYTVEGPVLRACLRKAIVKRLPLAMHLAEVVDEGAFLEELSGSLGREWEVMKSLDILDEEVPRMGGGPIRWAQRWGLLLADKHDAKPRALAVLLAHVNYCDHAELAQLAAARASVAYCPRTHAYFGHPPHRYRDMLAAGINVCLGTDSRASNPDLSVLNEARLLRERDGTDPYALLEMVTRRGAEALGMEEQVGTIAAGKAADMTLLPWTGEADAAEWAVRAAPVATGVWVGGRRVV